MVSYHESVCHQQQPGVKCSWLDLATPDNAGSGQLPASNKVRVHVTEILRRVPQVSMQLTPLKLVTAAAAALQQ